MADTQPAVETSPSEGAGYAQVAEQPAAEPKSPQEVGAEASVGSGQPEAPESAAQPQDAVAEQEQSSSEEGQAARAAAAAISGLSMQDQPNPPPPPQQQQIEQSQVDSSAPEVAAAGLAAEGEESEYDATGNEVVGVIPRYAMPNISSLLPNYANSEQEIIHRSFHTGNYDFLKHLPDTLKGQQVMATRAARMEAARRFLMPTTSGPKLKSHQDNQQGLFQAFEYMPSRYGLADELASKERAESEAKRMAVGGKEWTPSGADAAPLKNKDFTPGVLYPYLGGPYEATTDAEQAQKWLHAGQAVSPVPFVQAGTDKLADKPTKAMAWSMMNNIQKWIEQDWEGADVQIFENDQDCWVVRLDLSTVDSQEGLMAYMNVFIRCNELVNSYKLTKVVEFWNTAPGDGNVYYVVRPPWVRPDRLAAFFSLFPMEADWTTSAGVLEMRRTRAPTDPFDEKYPPNSLASTGLSFDSRLNWGTNFATGTAAPAPLGKMFGGGSSIPGKQ